MLKLNPVITALVGCLTICSNSPALAGRQIADRSMGDPQANGYNGSRFQQMPMQQSQPMMPGMQSMPQTQPVMPGATQQVPMQGRQATAVPLLRGWFDHYDKVRRQAQMTPSERNRADNLLSNGLAVFVPGEEKDQAQKLLRGLVAKYQVAVNEMKMMPLYPETEQLHRGYYQYFNDARALFGDYLRVQDNLMVKDERTGKSLMSELMQRKANLEGLEHQIKDLDQNLRGQLGIPAYHY